MVYCFYCQSCFNGYNHVISLNKSNNYQNGCWVGLFLFISSINSCFIKQLLWCLSFMCWFKEPSEPQDLLHRSMLHVQWRAIQTAVRLCRFLRSQLLESVNWTCCELKLLFRYKASMPNYLCSESISRFTVYTCIKRKEPALFFSRLPRASLRSRGRRPDRVIDQDALKTLPRTIFAGRTVNIWTLPIFSVGEWREVFSP